MQIKECFISENGMSCIISNSNIINTNIIRYTKNYLLFRIFEVIIKNITNDIIINFNDREKINNINILVPNIDFN